MQKIVRMPLNKTSRKVIAMPSKELREQMDSANNSIELLTALPDNLAGYMITHLSKHLPDEERKCLLELMRLVGPREQLMERFRKSLSARLFRERVVELLEPFVDEKTNEPQIRSELYRSLIDEELILMVDSFACLEYLSMISPEQFKVLQLLVQQLDICGERYEDIKELAREKQIPFISPKEECRPIMKLYSSQKLSNDNN